MENDESSPSKPHYDISMSKRTRKPLNLFTETNKSPQKPISPERENLVIGVNKEEEEEEEEKPPDAGANGHENDHKSLEELIKSRSSLGQHFTEEEKNLQVVVKQHEERLEGAQFKRLVSRYAKVLSRLVKIKQNGRLGSRKKPVLRLST